MANFIEELYYGNIDPHCEWLGLFIKAILLFFPQDTKADS